MFTPTRAIPAAAVIAIAAGAIPALTSAETVNTRDITVREKVRAVKFVHTNPSTRGARLATGDRVLTRQALSDENGHALGTLFTDCTNVGRPAQVFKATLQCTSTYRLRDGAVVSAGVVRLDSTQGLQFPIVGGSGAYRGAHGQVTPGDPVTGYDGVDVLHLDG
jgi:hypothetical protein